MERKIDIPTTSDGWYSFIVEMRSLHTSDTPRYKAMWRIFHDSVLKKIKDI